MFRPRLSEVAAVASVVAAGCTFLGWARSGRSLRSSYGLFQAAGRAGLLPDSIEQVGLLFFFVPVIAGAGLLAHAANRPRSAAVLQLVVGALVGGASLLVVLSPLNVEIPALVAGGTGTLTAAGSTLILLGRANGGRPTP